MRTTTSAADVLKFGGSVFAAEDDGTRRLCSLRGCLA